jgi:TPR repeat protein
MLNSDKSYTTLRFAPLGIHYGLAHAAVLIGKSDLAHRLARPLVRLGDASAQWYLGLMHQIGSGVEKDLAAARRLYATSAAQGFCMGEDGLLMLTASERQTYVDPALLKSQDIYSDIDKLKCSTRDTEVVFWEFQRGAELGDAEMQILLGQCYETGIFITAQWEIALEWYRRAGAQGNRSGLALYKKLSWSKLRDRGRRERCELEFVCELAANTTLKGPEPANEVDAFWWCFEAAQRGDRYACWRLYECYLMGWGVARDVRKSGEWSNYVIENGTSVAHKNYCDVLADTPRDELIDEEVLLNKRRQLRAEMARPISVSSPTLWDASTPRFGLTPNEDRRRRGAGA